MVVVNRSDLDNLSKLAKDMNCYYNYRSFEWEGVTLCEITSPLKVFLAVVRKKYMENDKNCQYFLNL